MAKAPDWLTEEGIERTYALGREMAEFLLRRDEVTLGDPNAKVEPHELLAQIEAVRARYERRTKPGSDASP